MADAQLIQVARHIGASKGFNTGWEEGAESILKYGEQVKDEIKERTAVKEKSAAKVAHYMNQIPSGADLPKVPPHAREATAAWLSSNRDEFAKHANAIRDLDPQDIEYQEHVGAMNKINFAYKNLNENLNTFLEHKTDYIAITEKNGDTDISKANDPRVSEFLSDAYTDNVGITIDESGSLLFGENSLLLKDFPEPITLAEEEAQPFEVLAQKVDAAGYTNGVDVYDEDVIAHTIDKTLRSVSRQALMSFAADSEDLFQHDLGVSDDLIHNPERTEELRELLGNAFKADTRERYLKGVARKVKVENEKYKVRASHKTPPKPKNSLDKFFPKNIDPAKQ